MVMMSLLAILDLYEQIVLVAILFTFVPIKYKGKKLMYYYLALVLLLFFGVRFLNSLMAFEGLATPLVIVITSLYLKMISSYTLPILLMFVGFTFAITGLSTIIVVQLISFILNCSIADTYANQSIYLSIVILIKIILTIVFFVLQKYKKKNYFEVATKKWIGLFLVQLLNYLIILIFMEIYFIGYDRVLIQLGILFSCGVLLAEIIAFRTLNAEAQEKQELKTINEKYEFEEKYYKQVLEQNSEIRKLKHDLNHTYMLISSYAKKEDYEKILSYLENIGLSDLETKKSAIITGNPTLDYILNSEKIICDNNGIDLITRLENIDLSFLSDFDICIIINNILKNSREHLDENNKWIRFSISSKQNSIVIACSNSAIERKKSDNSKYLPSRKEDKFYHGYGLLSIDKTVKKYDGDFNYYFENGKFICVVRFDK